MKIFKSIRLLLIILILLLHGCSSDHMELIFRNPFNFAQGLKSITVTPQNSSVPLGQSVQYSAQGNYSDGLKIDITDKVTWASLEKKIVKIGNRTESGPKGFATTHKTGSTIITAAIDNFSGNANITVTDKIIDNFTISPIASSVALGIDQQFTAIAHYSDNSTEDVTSLTNWESTDISVATINSSGLAESLSLGNTTIIATYNGHTLNTTLSVTASVLDHITISPINSTVALGVDQPFTATAHYTDGSTGDVTTSTSWISSDSSIANINASGIAETFATGTTTITAYYKGESENTSLTVTASVLDHITINPINSSVALGIDLAFTATAHYTDGSTDDITSSASWNSSSSSIANINTFGIAETLAIGTTTITADYNGLSVNTTLTVTDKVFNHITISPSSPSVALGIDQPFTATAHYTDGSTSNVTTSSTWNSSNASVANINTSGTAETLAMGTTTITAGYNGASATTTLTVTNKVFHHLTISPINSTVALGVDQPFTATAHYTDGSTSNVTSSTSWNSSNTSVANINTSGIADTLATGTTTITATYDSESAITTLTVTGKALDHITISPNNPSVALGVDQPFTATAHYTDGSTSNVTSSTSWNSSNTSVANINASGIAETFSKGTVKITADYNSQTASTTLTVTDKALDHITISPNNPSVALGVDPAFTATAHYTDGSTGDVTTSALWNSSNTSVANINASGIADTSSTGTTTITAGYNGESANTLLTVTNKELVAIDINPTNASVIAGLTQQYTALGHYTNGSTDDITLFVTWTSDNPGIASFSGFPGDEGLALGVSQGTTNITASFGGIDDTVQIVVTQKQLLSIEITPALASASINDTLQFTATGLYTDSSTDNITNSVTWASTNTGAATINSTGLATGLAVGVTQISATSGAISDTTNLTVEDNTPPVLENLNVVYSDSTETQLLLIFSKNVNPSTANTNGNYAFDLMGYGTNITSASRQADNSQVLVTVNPGLIPGMHEAWVINVEDLGGNAIIDNGIDNNIPFFINPPDEFNDGPVFVDPFFDGTRFAIFVEYDDKIYLGTNDASTKLFEIDKSFVSIQNIRLDADGNKGAPVRGFNGYHSKFSGCNFSPCYEPIDGVDSLYAACTGGSSTPGMTGTECTAAGGTETFFIGAYNTIGDYHSYWKTNDVSSSTTTFTYEERANPDAGGAVAFRSFNMYIFKEQLWNHYGAEFDGGGRGARICMKAGGCDDGMSYLQGSEPLLYYATRIGAKSGVPLRNGSHRANTFGGQVVPGESQVLKGIDFMYEYDQDGSGSGESQLYVANGGFYAGPLGSPRVNTSDGGIIRTRSAYSSKNNLPPSCPKNSSGCLSYWEDVTPDDNSDWNNFMSIMLPQNSAVTGEGNCSSSEIEMDCTEPYNVITSSLKAIPSMRTASNGDLYLIRNACNVNTVCLNGKGDCNFRTVKQTCPPGSEVPQLWMMRKNCGSASSCAASWRLVAEFGSSGKSNMQGNTGDCGTSPNKCSANRQITLLEVVGNYLYIGFDNPNYGANVWRANMSSIPSGSTPSQGSFELVNDFGLDGKGANKKIFSYISYSDSSDDWILVATGNGLNPVEIYRTSNNGDL